MIQQPGLSAVSRRGFMGLGLLASGSLMAGALAGCEARAATVTPYRGTVDQDEDHWVQTILATMSLQDQCAQLVMGPVCMIAGEMAVKVAGEGLEQGFRKTPLGGVVIDAGNIESVDQVQALTDNVRVLSASSGGSANAFIAMGYDGIAEAARAALGSDAKSLTLDDVPELLRTLGVNLYMGPHLDLGAHVNQDKSLAELAQEAKRLQTLCSQVSVVECPVGFPGSQAVQEGVGSEFTQKLIEPFKEAVDAGVSMIRMDDGEGPEGLPTTLDTSWIAMLRQDLGFEGVVLSSVIDYAAARVGLTLEQAALDFLHAGGDMIYVDDDPVTLAQQLAQAVERGDLDAQVVENAVHRVLQVKVSQGVQQF